MSITAIFPIFALSSNNPASWTNKVRIKLFQAAGNRCRRRPVRKPATLLLTTLVPSRGLSTQNGVPYLDSFAYKAVSIQVAARILQSNIMATHTYGYSEPIMQYARRTTNQASGQGAPPDLVVNRLYAVWYFAILHASQRGEGRGSAHFIPFHSMHT
ncbi:hypothetical protein CHU98_g12430 [Xylaria longipes]|nr:hypothetical protein CHU98_g12430 [Xylaria longipes]